MRYILPILTSAAVMICWLPPASAEDLAPDQDGNQLVAACVRSLAEQPSFEAKVRQRATVFGQRVTGAGFLVQMRDGERTLLRYEFKLQVADQSSSLLRVNDGTTLWLRRDMGGVKSQAYVNVRRLREAQKRAVTSAATLPDSGGPPDLALGGLTEIMRNIAEDFQFARPRVTELSGLPMWELAGTWKPQRLAQLLPEQSAAIGAGQPADTTKLPKHLPDTLKLLLGRDQNFPLFPYRIVFGRTQPLDVGTTTEPLVEPLVTMELYEVRRRPDLTAADFAFQLSDENVEDLTDTYLRKLGLTQKN